MNQNQDNNQNNPMAPGTDTMEEVKEAIETPKERFDYLEAPYIMVDGNTILFNIQDGPIKNNGRNGCQVDDMLLATRKVIANLNSRVPCRENALALTKIDEALHWLTARTADRVSRDVEGTSVK